MPVLRLALPGRGARVTCANKDYWRRISGLAGAGSAVQDFARWSDGSFKVVGRNGRYKWVFDGDRFAVDQVPVDDETRITHGELAEEHLQRPGASAADIDAGTFWLEDQVAAYKVYFSSEDPKQLEEAIREWVARHLGVRLRDVTVVRGNDDDWSLA